MCGSREPNPHEDILLLYKYFLNFFGCIIIIFVIYAMMMRKYFAIADDVHAEVREGETGTVRGLSTVPKDSQNNELDLII